MRQIMNRGRRIRNRWTAFFLCGVLLLSMPIGNNKVCATESSTATGTGTSENATTETSTFNNPTNNTTSQTENIDPNGKLGKNSDIGLELAESITGKIGKKLKIGFKLTSNKVDTIKVKGVYPVIDNSFPFETSGDAYKVISSGEDVELQKCLPAEYELTSRSDITTGYHGIRFIAEYSKISANGTSEDFYVIKTINIYFSNAADTGSNNNGGNNTGSDDKKNNNSNNKNTSTGGSSSNKKDDDDDDDSSSGSGGGYSGGGGSSSDEEAVAPKLVITGFDTKPEKIMAGETFTITIHIQNTSKNVSLCNGKFLVGNEAGTFLPTSGSSAVYIEKIEPEKTGDLVMEMKTSADLPQKNYMLVVKGDFDDGKGNNFTSSDNLSVSVYQKVKLNVTDVSMTPNAIAIGGEGSLMFTINNPGSAGVNNVRVNAKDESVSAPEAYVGNIAGSSSAYATLNVTGEKDNSVMGMITIEITYEDSEGVEGKLEQQVACIVGEDVEMTDSYDEGDDEYDEDYEDSEGLPRWLLIVLIAVAAVLVVGIIIFLMIRKKKRMAALLAEEDGEDDLGNEDF